MFFLIDAEHMLFMGSTKFPDENEVPQFPLYEIFAVYSELISSIIYRLHVHFMFNGACTNETRIIWRWWHHAITFLYGFIFEACGKLEFDSSGGPKLELTSLGCMQYDKFLSQHGGSSNAYTDQEFTCYHFEVINKCFRDALERWTNSLQLCNTFPFFDD